MAIREILREYPLQACAEQTHSRRQDRQPFGVPAAGSSLSLYIGSVESIALYMWKCLGLRSRSPEAASAFRPSSGRAKRPWVRQRGESKKEKRVRPGYTGCTPLRCRMKRDPEGRISEGVRRKSGCAGTPGRAAVLPGFLRSVRERREGRPHVLFRSTPPVEKRHCGVPPGDPFRCGACS